MLPKFDQIVFYTKFLADIYEKYYGVSAKKINIILNPVFRRESPEVERAAEPTVLFAGRFVAYKNLELVIRVFDKVRSKIGRGRLIMIGEGPDKEKLDKIIKGLPSAADIKMIPKMNQEKLFEHISLSTVGIGPALTEFNPNFILECLSLGKPVLISRENGLSVKLPEEFLFDVDVGSEQELEIKLANFFDEIFYQKALETVSNLQLNQTWQDVIRGHLNVLKSVGFS